MMMIMKTITMMMMIMILHKADVCMFSQQSLSNDNNHSNDHHADSDRDSFRGRAIYTTKGPPLIQHYNLQYSEEKLEP